MDGPKPGMEFEIRRHPEKSGTEVVNPQGEKIPLPQEGIQQTQVEAQKFAERVRDIPRAVVLGFTSNQPRTSEADYIFGQELRVMAERLGNSQVFDRDKEGSLEEIAAKVQEGTDKVVLINSPVEAGLGMKNWDMKYYGEKMKELGGEIPFLIQWAQDPEIQRLVGVSYNEIQDDFKNWLAETQKKAAQLFPGRPVIVTGIGHSFELDAALASVMGKKMSEKTMQEMGGEIIKTMEGARIVIDTDGKGTVEYRDMKVDLDLDEETGEAQKE